MILPKTSRFIATKTNDTYVGYLSPKNIPLFPPKDIEDGMWVWAENSISRVNIATIAAWWKHTNSPRFGDNTDLSVSI